MPRATYGDGRTDRALTASSWSTGPVAVPATGVPAATAQGEAVLITDWESPDGAPQECTVGMSYAQVGKLNPYPTVLATGMPAVEPMFGAFPSHLVCGIVEWSVGGLNRLAMVDLPAGGLTFRLAADKVRLRALNYQAPGAANIVNIAGAVVSGARCPEYPVTFTRTGALPNGALNYRIGVPPYAYAFYCNTRAGGGTYTFDFEDSKGVIIGGQSILPGISNPTMIYLPNGTVTLNLLSNPFATTYNISCVFLLRL